MSCYKLVITRFPLILMALLIIFWPSLTVIVCMIIIVEIVGYVESAVCLQRLWIEDFPHQLYIVRMACMNLYNMVCCSAVMEKSRVLTGMPVGPGLDHCDEIKSESSYVAKSQCCPFKIWGKSIEVYEYYRKLFLYTYHYTDLQ